MLLAIFLAGAILWNLPWSKYDNVFFVSAVEPGYLDFDNLPDTNFSCEGKVIGGYYADIETGCQMFHVCTIGQKSEITDIKFLCLNGTVFDQETRVCERLDEVDCSRSESFFDLNLELYGNHGGGYGIQPEDDGKETERVHCEEDYEDGETSNSCQKKAQTNGTEHNKEPSEYGDWEESTAPASVTQLSDTSSSSTTTTTTARPTITSSSTRPPSTGPPPNKFLFHHSKLSHPSTTADPSLQLLALHESFQQNIKQHDAQSKLRPINVPSGGGGGDKNSTAFSFSKMPAPPPPPPPPPYPGFSAGLITASNGPQSAPHNPPPSSPSSSSKPSSPFYPLPSKLPNTLSNLSQNNKNTFASSLANSNRTPPSPPSQQQLPPFAVPTFKSEPRPASSYFSSNNNKHSQKVMLTPPPLPQQQQPPPSAAIALPQPPKQQHQQQQQQPRQNVDPSLLFTYKIVGDGGRPDRFRSPPLTTHQYANFAASPVPASAGQPSPASPFRTESSLATASGNPLAHHPPTFVAIAQNRPYPFRPSAGPQLSQQPPPTSHHHYLPQLIGGNGGGGSSSSSSSSGNNNNNNNNNNHNHHHRSQPLLSRDEGLDEEAVEVEEDEEGLEGVEDHASEEPSEDAELREGGLPATKSDDYESHTNFARAIADRPQNGHNGSDAAAISVVLSTSSVSSSISSKPQSAISNSTHPTSSSSSNTIHRANAFRPGAGSSHQFLANSVGASGPSRKIPVGLNANSFVASTLRSNNWPTMRATSSSSSQPNITEINEALTEEPYYEEGEEEGANIEYEDNSSEYKDLAYPSDVRKIRQR